ncbi:hypothetical protein ACFDTO_31255 [Microbacteriaceae bacterium 4G12]
MGSKKKAALHGLSKKERKALEKKAEALRAELAEREAAKAAKKGKKSKDEKPAKKGKSAKLAPVVAAESIETEALTVTPAAADAKAERKAKREAKAAKEGADESTPASKIAAAARAVIEGNSTPDAVADAEDSLAAALEANPGETIEEIQARVAARRQARADGVTEAEIQARVTKAKAARMPDAREGETEVEYQQRRLAEKKADKPVALAAAGEAVEAIRQAVEVVETETGREFAAGESVATDDFAKPSEAPRELEEGRNGYKIIQLDAAGKPDPRKVRQMTRVTTFVSNIDDETTLKKWDKRNVAEGLALDATSPESAGLVPKINELAHRRDVAIAKAIKADRKGRLGVGEVATLIADAEKVAKDAIDAIVEEAAELAGRSSKARAGTHLHALAEISDEKGIDEVRRMHEAGETILLAETGEDVPITATDLASIEAYDERMRRLGAKVIESEAVIVNDEMGYAGRLDRIIMARLPELVIGKGTLGEYVRPADQRARRYVADIKSGRVDLGAGKIARQLAAYALGDLYDLETGERTRHSAVRDVALVFHLPQGAGVCTVHPVDLKAGTTLLKLSAEVRRARNTGRKTIDTSVDIAGPATEGEGE